MSEPRITLAEIERISGLASLDLSAAEKELLVHQFEEILDFFKIIAAVKPPEVQDHTVDEADHLRDDEAVASGVSPDSFSPYLENGHFKVPKVIE